MSVGRHVAPVSLALALALAIACGRGDEATASAATGDGGDTTDMFDRACAEIFSCWCVDYGHDDEASCAAELRDEALLLYARALDDGEVFDWGCYERQLEINRLGCAPRPSQTTQDPGFYMECPSCQVSPGDAPLGAPCVGTTSGSTCAQGLRCSHHEAGFCYDPCAPPELDAPCPDPGCGEGMVCDWSRRCRPEIGRVGDNCAYFGVVCGPGLVCDWTGDEDSTCAPALDPGAPCSAAPGTCPADYYCSTVCTPRPGVGEPCLDTSCEAGAACDSRTSTCVAVPAIGEPCVAGECELGALCASATSTCTRLPAAGQPCVDGRCAEGSLCDPGGTCSPEPAVCRNP